MTEFTTAPWNGSAGRWPDASSYCASAMVDNNPSGAEKTKSECHFPIRAPGSAVVNVNALRAVVGGRGAQADFAGAQAARERARRLLAEYNNSTSRSEEAETMPEESVVYRITPEILRVTDDDEGPVVEGRIVPYEQWSEVDSVIEGNFLERFARGSFAKTLAEQIERVKVYFDHGKSAKYGRQPIGDLREAWETDDGLYFRSGLLNGLDEIMVDGLRKGLYGASVGARVVRSKVDRFPDRSDRNPKRLEERTYTEMRAFDFSITSQPHYDGTTLALRSVTDDLMWKTLASDPVRLLQLARENAEPTHPELESRPTQQQDEAAPGHSEGERRATQVEEEPARVPSRDYLAPTEEEPAWRLP
jgi:phage head maturation protease